MAIEEFYNIVLQPVGILHRVVRNAIYAYTQNDFGHTNIYVEVAGIMTRLHRNEDTFWFQSYELHFHENSKLTIFLRLEFMSLKLKSIAAAMQSRLWHNL